jgi:hypothetical protein
MAGIGFGGQGSTYEVIDGNGLGPRTLVVTVTNTGDSNPVSAENLQKFIQAVANSGATITLGTGGVLGANASDAFTVAGVSGEGTATVTVVLQGTGVFRVGDDKHVTGLTTAIVSTINQNP